MTAEEITDFRTLVDNYGKLDIELSQEVAQYKMMCILWQAARCMQDMQDEINELKIRVGYGLKQTSGVDAVNGTPQRRALSDGPGATGHAD